MISLYLTILGPTNAPKVSPAGPPTTGTGGGLEGTELVFEDPEIRFHNGVTRVSDTTHAGDLKCPGGTSKGIGGAFGDIAYIFV